MPNQGVAIHMLTPFFFFELKTEEEQVTLIIVLWSNQLYWRHTCITELQEKHLRWFGLLPTEEGSPKLDKMENNLMVLEL